MKGNDRYPWYNHSFYGTLYFDDETCFCLKTSPLLILILLIQGKGIGNKIEQAMITLQEMAVFNSLYGS